MTELAVNTAEKRGQLLLLKNKEVIDEIFWEGQGSHSEAITSEFQKVLENHNIQSTDLKNIYCVVGPGSFTGLRVGVSFSKTLGYLNSLSLQTINSLDLLALNCKKNDLPIVSLMDAQKNSVFCSTYSWKNGNRIKEKSNLVIPIEELKGFLKNRFYYCGQGLNKYKSFLDQSFLKDLQGDSKWEQMDLKNLFGKDKLCLNTPLIPWNEVQPLYIKASAPEEKLKQKSQKKKT